MNATHLRARRFAILSFILLAVCPALFADDAAEKKDAKYLLRYKYKKGETIQMQVLHLATTETRIRGNLQTSRSRGLSVKEWRIKSVKPDGEFQFEHVVTKADMSSEVSGRAKVSYNSETPSGDEVPEEYADVAGSIGKVIAELTVKNDGEIVKQDHKYRQYSFGLGQMVFPLPKEPIAVGHEWHFPTEITCTEQDGKVKRVKTRQRYTLVKVAHGLATIDVVTQVLTPINDPKIEVQLMQQLTKGTVKFDIDAGRITNQRMDWNEKAVGFNGADSVMEYVARFEEKILSSKVKTAAKQGPAVGPKR